MLKNLLEVDPAARRDRRTRLFSGAKVKKRSTRRSESKGSLNAATRRKRMEKISAENKHLLKRIINCAPTMSRSEWKQRERKHKRALRRLAENSTNRPRPMTAESAIVYHPNAIREPARGRRTRRRPKSASRARPSRSVLAGERSDARQRPKTAMGRRRRARAAGAGERPLSARN